LKSHIPYQVEIARILSSRYGNPLGAPRDVCYSWASDLGLKRGGDTVLYTGCLYQLMAFTGSLVKLYERLGILGIRAARAIARISEGLLAWFISRAASPDMDVYSYALRSLRSVVELLKRCGIEFGYLYDGDQYSGVYLYELGLEEEFAGHARAVYKELVRRGVKRVITVDPHTTYILREVYPRYVESFSLEVIHYIELVRTPKAVERPHGPQPYAAKPPVIHDSCYIVRKLGLYRAVRDSLSNIRYIEPKNSGVRTLCCGGPIEGISPRLALQIAVKRARELASTGSERVVVMCPICFVNLKRALDSSEYRATIVDLSEEISGLHIDTPQ